MATATDKRVLVTGGAGYIGSHTAKALAKAGFTPVVLDNLSMGHRESVRWGPFIHGDISDEGLLRRTLHEERISAVVHFAASAFVGESMQKPRLYFRNNLVNSFLLLDAMMEAGVRHIVFSSTCATYGNPESIPIDEQHVQKPVNPYGESKLCVERMLRWLGETEGLGWIALRYFNAAGADPDGEIGEDHTPETHLIPSAIEAALGMRDELQVYGSDYPTPDGTAIRDYIHVTDLAEAHVLALGHLIKGGQNDALNLGSGKGHSIREVIRSIEQASGLPVPRRELSRRPGDPAVLIANSSRAYEILGWRPTHSGLQTIVETAWQWHSRHASKLQPSGLGRV
jgi:UDP-arabinose 4-epimerase